MRPRRPGAALAPDLATQCRILDLLQAVVAVQETFVVYPTREDSMEYSILVVREKLDRLEEHLRRP